MQGIGLALALSDLLGTALALFYVILGCGGIPCAGGEATTMLYKRLIDSTPGELERAFKDRNGGWLPLCSPQSQVSMS